MRVFGCSEKVFSILSPPLLTTTPINIFTIPMILLMVKVLHNGSLVLWRVGLQDRGDYTCKAANKVTDQIIIMKNDNDDNDDDDDDDNDDDNNLLLLVVPSQ